MKWTGYIFIFIALSGCLDLIDEEIPSSPSNLTGYYTHSYDSPRVHLSWDKHESEDIHEYHIYRSIDEGITFDFLEKVSKNRLIYEAKLYWNMLTARRYLGVRHQRSIAKVYSKKLLQQEHLLI